MENTFGNSSNIFFAVAPEDRNATSARALEAIAWLTEKSWQIPYSTRVDSIVNFQHITAGGDDILVRDLVDEAARGDATQRDRIRAIALSEPRLAARLIARDGEVSGINVDVKMPGDDELLEGPLVANAARTLAEAARERFPDLEV